MTLICRYLPPLSANVVSTWILVITCSCTYSFWPQLALAQAEWPVQASNGVQGGAGAQTEDHAIRVRRQGSDLHSRAGLARTRPRVVMFPNRVTLKCPVQQAACANETSKGLCNGIVWMVKTKASNDAPQPVTAVFPPRRLSAKRKRLVIKRFLAKFSGRYWCKVGDQLIQTWDVTRMKHNNSIVIQRVDYPGTPPVTEPPPLPVPLRFTVRPGSLHLVRPGERVLMRCSASGHPRPHITWLRGFRVISKRQGRIRVNKDNCLEFASVERDDEDTYRCVVENRMELLSSTAQLYVV
eukprot:scpid73508/ scgid11559/ Peroxidasin